MAKLAGFQQEIESLLAIYGLEKHYLYHSILGEFHLQLNQLAPARHAFQTALALTRSATEIILLQHKLTLALSAERNQTQPSFSIDPS
jgi:predicted RNA polymerase sigma factor